MILHFVDAAIDVDVVSSDDFVDEIRLSSLAMRKPYLFSNKNITRMLRLV